jgi:hypothetical protein
MATHEHSVTIRVQFLWMHFIYRHYIQSVSQSQRHISTWRTFFGATWGASVRLSAVRSHQNYRILYDIKKLLVTAITNWHLQWVCYVTASVEVRCWSSKSYLLQQSCILQHRNLTACVSILLLFYSSRFLYWYLPYTFLFTLSCLNIFGSYFTLIAPAFLTLRH